LRAAGRGYPLDTVEPSAGDSASGNGDGSGGIAQKVKDTVTEKLT